MSRTTDTWSGTIVEEERGVAVRKGRNLGNKQGRRTFWGKAPFPQASKFTMGCKFAGCL